MKKRLLGKTGVKISEVGLGTWQLGSADWGAVDEKQALAILHKAVEQGVNFFDTADVYGMGVSERVIGKFLKETRETVHVATKLCRVEWASADGQWPERFTVEMARQCCRKSCANLGVDALFLQQWHCPPTEWMRQGEIFEHMEQLKKEGLIQHWGCSVETVDEGLICAEHPGCASLQVIYNIFRQKITDELLPVAKRKNIGILARVPLASGLLTGKFERGHSFAETDHRNYNADGAAFNVGETFGGVPFDKGVDLAERIRTILEPADAAMAQLALRWILDHDAVSAVIPGASRAEHVKSNAAASAVPPLSEESHRLLKELYEQEILPSIRGPY